MRTRVKICGITRLEDALLSIDLGADALGFVFYPPSPRAVSIAQAAEIIKNIPPFVTTTALFVDAEIEFVRQVVEATGVDLLQFHGDETAEYCSLQGRPYIKALRVRPSMDLNALQKAYSGAQGLLLDAYREGVPGGTGETFDWSLIPGEIARCSILAGGLNDANVQSAIEQVSPYAVDVSGGVESSKGIKDFGKLQRFFESVASAQP